MLETWEDLLKAFEEDEWNETRMDAVHLALQYLSSGERPLADSKPEDYTGDERAAFDLLPEGVVIKFQRFVNDRWTCSIDGCAEKSGDLAYAICSAYVSLSYRNRGAV